jgi:hypothetical protein
MDRIAVGCTWRRSAARWALGLAAAACAARAEAQVYLNPYVAGISPDKPWHATGSAPLYGLDVGVALSPEWCAELDVDGASLRERSGNGHTDVDGGALGFLRLFNLGGRIQPYLGAGIGLTHNTAAPQTSLEAHTEFMVQPEIGTLVRLWESADGSRELALRPDVRVRWTHGWAHAPGNPVDPIYGVGITFAWLP